MMTRIVLIGLFVLLIQSCGSTKPAPVKPDQKIEDVMADVLVRPGEGKASIEITFYTQISEIVDGKENKGFGKNVIAVEDPKLNGHPLMSGTNLSNQPVYKTDVSKTVAQNVISATINGKQFEGTTMIETQMMNKMTTVALDQK